jgi:hypothetical protein
MPSERIQKRIDLLLDQADAAAESNDWLSVRAHARAVLIADPDSADAKTLLAMAEELAPETAQPQTSAEESGHPVADPEAIGELVEGSPSSGAAQTVIRHPEALEGSAVAPSPLGGEGKGEGASKSTAELPSTFAGGRYTVKSLLGEGGKKRSTSSTTPP